MLGSRSPGVAVLAPNLSPLTPDCEFGSTENDTHEHIRSGTCSQIDGSGTEVAAGAGLPGVRYALRRAAHALPSGPAAALLERVQSRFFLRLLPAPDQPAGQGRTGQAAGKSHRQRNQLLPA